MQPPELLTTDDLSDRSTSIRASDHSRPLGPEGRTSEKIWCLLCSTQPQSMIFLSAPDLQQRATSSRCARREARRQNPVRCTSVGRDPEAKLRPRPRRSPSARLWSPTATRCPSISIGRVVYYLSHRLYCVASSEAVGSLPEGCAGLCQHAQGQPAEMGKPADTTHVLGCSIGPVALSRLVQSYFSAAELIGVPGAQYL